VRTHVAAYFVSLLVSDLIQAIGSILNAHWISQRAVEVGSLCSAQGVLKQIADVSTAVWTMVIATHTFCLLFLELKSSRFTLIATLISGWSGIAAVVIAGPAAMDTVHHGPFYGISGYWCWIGPHWNGSRVGLDYLFMFMAAFFSFLLYMAIFLRMRGNIIVEGRRISFRIKKAAPWRGKQFESQALTIARQMLLYPVAYTILILPIAASRFSAFAGEDVPFGVTVFSAAVFLLSGIVNVTLFTMTRRILPPESFRIPKWKISQPKPIPELSINPDYADTSYYQSSGSYTPSMTEKADYPASLEKPLPALTPLRLNTGLPPAPMPMAIPSIHLQPPPPPESVHHRDSRDTRVESFYNMYDREPTSH